MFRGSDIRSITINNPTANNRNLFCKAGEAAEIKLGGLKSEVSPTGNGQIIVSSTNESPSCKFPPIAYDPGPNDELTYLTAVKNSGKPSQITIAIGDFAVAEYSDAYITGDILADTKAGSITGFEITARSAAMQTI